ncbi:methylated-DNA--[protein]-cysteine S-methyltransferase [bacterium]|nr:methylated-DNA--[protein]-cysteine S-methyltransferase [bacterium]
MIFKSKYITPDGFDDIVIESDGKFLTGLRFEQCKSEFDETENLPVFAETCRWLDIYFSGRQPDWMPKYKIEFSSAFRKEVLEETFRIPFGKTMTYGEMAQRIASRLGITKMSAQAVGGALGWNPLCIMIPCHRVIGANGKLTGYGGGIKNKTALLELEKSNFTD